MCVSACILTVAKVLFKSHRHRYARHNGLHEWALLEFLCLTTVVVYVVVVVVFAVFTIVQLRPTPLRSHTGRTQLLLIRSAYKCYSKNVIKEFVLAYLKKPTGVINYYEKWAYQQNKLAKTTPSINGQACPCFPQGSPHGHRNVCFEFIIFIVHWQLPMNFLCHSNRRTKGLQCSRSMMSLGCKRV